MCRLTSFFQRNYCGVFCWHKVYHRLKTLTSVHVGGKEYYISGVVSDDGNTSRLAEFFFPKEGDLGIWRGGSRGEVAEHFLSILGLEVKYKPRKTNHDIGHHVNICLKHLNYFVKKFNKK